jgi:hypothetical protein
VLGEYGHRVSRCVPERPTLLGRFDDWRPTERVLD